MKQGKATYNVLGRMLTSTATDGAITSYSYWDGYINGSPYLHNEVTNPRDNRTTTKTDIWGRVVLVTPPPSTGPAVSYTYDAADRLLTVVRGVATTTLTYDFSGRKTNMSDPDMGAWVYTYDALGNLKTQTDAKSCITTLAYDSLNRLTGKTYSGACSGIAVAYTYDSGTNGKGRRKGMTDGSGSTSWTYDSRGSMTQESKTITGSGTFVTQWGYNSADQPIWMKYPANNTSGIGEQVNYTYLPQMLLDTVIGTSTYVYNTDYDATSRVTMRELGVSSGASIIKNAYTYFDWTTLNGQGRLQNIHSYKGTTDLQNLSYTYDEIGNVKTILDAKNSNQKQCFLYDSLDRLTRGTTQLSDSFCQATHVGNGQYDESYVYNLTTGNLSSKGGYTLGYGDTNHKHATTSWNGWLYSYDQNGNMTSRTYGGVTYTLSYDAENRMTGMTGGGVSASFVYDGDGNRVKGTMGGVTTTYIGNPSVPSGQGYFEWISPAGTMKKYYYASGMRVAMREGSNNPLWILGDHLGSTSKVVNFDGLTEHSQQMYKPWGEKRYPTGAPTLPTTFRYTGQRSETGLGPSGGEGLMFYGARWYDPSLARFIQADSIVPGGVQGLDRYAYSYNNPVKYTDPSGHCPWCIAALVGAVVGAAVNAGIQVGEGILQGQSFGEAVSNIDVKEVIVYAVAGAVTGATFGAINPVITSALIPELAGVGTTASGAIAGTLGGQAAAITDAGWNQGENIINGNPINGNQFLDDAQDAGLGDASQMLFDGVTGGFLAGTSRSIVNDLINPQPLYLGTAKTGSAVLQGIGASSQSR